MRKNLLLVFILLAVVTGLVSSHAQSAEPIVVRWFSHEYKPWNDLLWKQAEEYMKLHPEVKIDYTHILHADLSTKLMPSFAAGTASDVIGVYGPWMRELVDGGWIAPAPDWAVDDIQENHVAIAKQSAEYNDKIYGYLQHVGLMVPIINAGMYQKAGIGEPAKTYEELIALNKEFFDKGEPDSMIQAGTSLSATRAGSWNVIHWAGILFAYGGQILTPDGKMAAFNSPEGLQATDIYRQLAHPELLAGNEGDAFLLERVAMELNGPWIRSYYKDKAPNLQYKALAPLKGSAKQGQSMYAWFWVVNSKSSPAIQEEAWKFLQYLSNVEQYLEIWEQIGLIPFQKSLLTDPRVIDDEWFKTFMGALEFGKVYYSTSINNWEEIDKIIGRQLERVTTGEVSSQEMLEATEKEVNDALR